MLEIGLMILLLQKVRHFACAAKKAFAGIKETLNWLAQSNAQVDSTTYGHLLKQCGNSRALAEGKLLHAHIIKGGYDQDVFLGNLLVQMYGKCGSLDDACKVFQGLAQPNEYSWTMMVAAYAQNGHLQDARSLLERMPHEKEVALTIMMTTYSRDGDPQRAREMFEMMAYPNVVSWTAMITAYSQNGYVEEALRMFRLMVLGGAKPDDVTFVTVFDACASLEDFQVGELIHASILDEVQLASSTKVSNALLSMYSKCGNLQEAQKVFGTMAERNMLSWNAMVTAYAKNGHLEDAWTMFNDMPERDVVSWTTMITAFSQYGYSREALQVFRRMNLEGEKPNEVTFLSVLDACVLHASSADIESIHCGIIDSGYRSDLKVENALLNVYGKSGNLQVARSMFDTMTNRGVVAWTAMIGAYAQSQCSRESLHTFRLMDLEGIKPNGVTFINVVDACASLGAVEGGEAVHARVRACGLHVDPKVGNAVVNMYGKFGRLLDAKNAFDEILHKNVISWSGAIAVCAQNGQGKEALNTLKLMDMEGFQPEEITYISIIDSCAGIPALSEGRLIHSEIINSGIQSGLELANALIDMYGKCGSIQDARKVFDGMLQRDVVSWTALITAYAENGADFEALGVFQDMQLDGVKPNQVTFLNVLTACSHAGLLEDGWCYFLGMRGDHGVGATADHYVCMVDLLARAGRLSDAEDLINEMPYEPEAVAWATLLGASRIHGDRKKGACSAKNVLKFKEEADHSANYILLSQIYAGKQVDAP